MELSLGDIVVVELNGKERRCKVVGAGELSDWVLVRTLEGSGRGRAIEVLRSNILRKVGD